MSTLKQVHANHLNALNSTGPKTSQGKERSRCNALRHGLTAETVIVGLEDVHDYEAFEATVIADYDAQSAVERELVLRLASVLWRLRRATGIETSLFQTVIKQSGQSEASSRASADPALVLEFGRQIEHRASYRCVSKRVHIADIRAVDRHANLSNEPAQSL